MMGLIGVSVAVCLALLLVVPGLAAQPVQGQHPGRGFGNVSETTMLAHAENLTATLSGKGVDVTGLNGALTDAQNAIQSSNTTAFRDAMKEFTKTLLADLKNGSIPKTDIRQGMHPGVPKSGTFTMTPAMETKELGFAQNITKTLSTKGVDVSGLNAALTDAQNAIQSSNTTAFKDAMKTFTQTIRADIKSGTIPQSDLPKITRGPATGNGVAGLMKNHAKGTNTTHTS